MSDSLMKAVAEAIEREAYGLREAAIESAVIQFEQDLRAAVGKVAVQATGYYEMHKRGEDLVVKVRHETSK